MTHKSHKTFDSTLYTPGQKNKSRDAPVYDASVSQVYSLTEVVLRARFHADFLPPKMTYWRSQRVWTHAMDCAGASSVFMVTKKEEKKKETELTARVLE